jgi:DNA-directed RNA polymerase II subunit RPB2
MEDIAWKLIDKYFTDNQYNLVTHHLDSYNDFFDMDIKKVLKDSNPLRFIEKMNASGSADRDPYECKIYMGGRDGSQVFRSKAVIYDDDKMEDVKLMYPNLARLRNMTYGVSLHCDIVIDLFYYEKGEKVSHTITKDRVFMCKIPIMLHSNLCVLRSLNKETRYNMGECRQDFGGYFIIDGKEKVVVGQEKFADNMMYIKKHTSDSKYLCSSEVRSVSEDPSKPIRTTSVNLVAPSTKFSNLNIVVMVPNVRIPVPLFILMRALGVVSDKQIIEYCLLDLESNDHMVDLFIPSVHDTDKVFSQEAALHYIKEFTKRRTINGVLEILMDLFLPHVGTRNFIDKAYFVGHMVNKLLRVHTKVDAPTDRDNFMYKRVDLTGTLMYQLFREFYLLQKVEIEKRVDKEFYYHASEYIDNFTSLIETNHTVFFKPTVLEKGIRDAFKGKWGATERTTKVGVVQDLNRLSYNSYISQLRKFNLPLDPTAKVTGPRLLHASQWGYIDPVDTPDGGNCGLHKHMAISTRVTSGGSANPMIIWLRTKTTMKLLPEANTHTIAAFSKVFVNGRWVGVLDNPIETITMFKLYRRAGLMPSYNSISFKYDTREIYIYTDAGRLTRPLYYMRNGTPSYDNKGILKKIMETPGEYRWTDVVRGFGDKIVGGGDGGGADAYYDIKDMYPAIHATMENDPNAKLDAQFKGKLAVVDYLDTSEASSQFVATTFNDLKTSKQYTHMEIHPSLILGVMGNSIIFPEENPSSRNTFSCGQARQAVSIYHSNFQSRIDKMSVVLNYGQVPLLKSRYLKYINNEELPCGVNTIVAIMSYTGYNVEDAILINQGAVDRGLFRTTYFSMYEAREDSAKTSKESVDTRFADVLKVPDVERTKPKYDYDNLNEMGIIREGTEMDDKTVVIGKVVSSTDIMENPVDDSVFPKKGQLGIVDKAFITEGEEGTRVAKVRVREERIPAIGDKMASRAGQKGTIGRIIPEADMPYTKDGTVPDLIINPHAIPSRMTIGQLMESVIGKAGTMLGGYGDCTAFTTKGANTDAFGRALVQNGFHASGNDIMYNGMTGEQLAGDIFMGPTYYMRLKHMVKDKINSRADGPKTELTRQAVQGRANDGGLKIGEMERDGIMAHGASAFLNDAFMKRCDEYKMLICNKTGGIAVYNPELNLMMSPHADGPLRFNITADGRDPTLDRMTRFGRSFSVVRVPFAFKLLLQELQAMNVHMKIITAGNVNNLLTMNYSDNINKLMRNDDGDLNNLMKQVNDELRGAMRYGEKVLPADRLRPDPVEPPAPERDDDDSIPYAPGSDDSIPYAPDSDDSIPYAPDSGSSRHTPFNSDDSIPYAPDSDDMRPPSPTTTPPAFARAMEPMEPLSDDEFLSEPVSNDDLPKVATENELEMKNPYIQAQFDALGTKDKMKLVEAVAQVESERVEKVSAAMAAPAPQPIVVNTPTVQMTQDTMGILKVDEPPTETGDDDDKSDDAEKSGGGVKKVVAFSQ